MNNILYEECIHALGQYTVFNESQSKEIFDKFEKSFPIVACSGSIDWMQIEHIVFFSHDSFYNYILQNNNIDMEANILWDDFYLPVVKSKLRFVLNAIDDVIAVSPHTYIVVGGNLIEYDFGTNKIYFSQKPEAVNYSV